MEVFCMKNAMQVFDYGQRQVRTMLIGGKPWFVLIDVCRSLELKNPTMIASRLDDDEVTKFDLGSRSGVTNIVNESGLYSVILRSDKPEARKFKRWITHEVLPSIRKTGQYIAPKAKPLPDPLKAQRVQNTQQRLAIAQQNANLRKAQMWLKMADREKNIAKKRGYENRAERILNGESDEPANVPALEAAFGAGEWRRQTRVARGPRLFVDYLIDCGVADGTISNSPVSRAEAYEAYKRGYNS
jgi:prophage antirepressor-like protein